MFFKAERKSALAVVLALCIMFIAVPVFAQGGNETAAKVDMTKDADGIAWVLNPTSLSCLCAYGIHHDKVELACS